MAEFLTSQPAWIGAFLIFSLRVIEISLDTVRVLMVMRGKKGAAWFLGFFQASIFVIAISYVLTGLDNPIKILGYAAGFATGTLVGMLIEEKLAIGHIQLSIISPRRGAALAEELRAEGYAITEIPARGKDGMVAMLSCSVLRKNVEKVRSIANQVDATAFITAEDVRPVRRGFWRA
jgi:uncharacterized protein YebE (UPF0316 family)